MLRPAADGRAYLKLAWFLLGMLCTWINLADLRFRNVSQHGDHRACSVIGVMRAILAL